MNRKGGGGCGGGGSCSEATPHRGSPPFPRPLPRPFSPPQATQPAQLPAESKVRYSASPTYPRAPSAYRFPAVLPSRSRTRGGGARGKRGRRALAAPRDSGRAATLRAPERQRRPPRPLPPGPPSARTRAAWARIIACLVTNGSGPFQGRESRYSASSSGAASPGEGRGNPAPRRERRRFERARSGDWAAYSGKNGCLGRRGAGGGSGLAPAMAARRGINRSPSLGSEVETAGLPFAGAVGPHHGGGPLARDCCCSPSPFLKEKFYVGHITYWTDQ